MGDSAAEDMGVLKFKGYEGSAEVDLARGVCRGKLLFIEDLITYEAETPKQLQNEFEAAVDDYLQTRFELGREPARQFPVRPQIRYIGATPMRKNNY